MTKAYAAKEPEDTGYPIGYPVGLEDEGYPSWPEGWAFPGPPWPPGWNEDLYEEYLASLWIFLGGYGSGQYQFYSPQGKIAYNETTEYIYITDTLNNRIVKTKIDGTGWTVFGSYGTGINQFKNPKGIFLISETDFFYVLDTGNKRIVLTDINGSVFETLNLTLPIGINPYYSMDYDEDSGFFYISDIKSWRIIKTKFDGSGYTYTNPLSLYFPYGNPAFCCYEKSTGFIYVTTWSGYLCKIKIDNSEPQVLSNVASVGELIYSSEKNKIFFSKKLSTSPSGYRIYAINPDGSGLMLSCTGPEGGVGYRYNSINGYCYKNGSLFFTTGDHGIIKANYNYLFS